MAAVAVVDDDPQALPAYCGMVGHLGHQPIPFNTGWRFIESLKAAPPSAVLMDVALGDLHGLEILRLLKHNRATAALPVILMSGVLVDEETARSALDYGASAFLSKPTILSDLSIELSFALSGRLQWPAIAAKDLLLDPRTRRVFRDGPPVRLSRELFYLLQLLVSRAPHPVSRAFLTNALRCPPHGQALAQLVYRLRRELGPVLGARIKTLHGEGFALLDRAVEGNENSDTSNSVI